MINSKFAKYRLFFIAYSFVWWLNFGVNLSYIFKGSPFAVRFSVWCYICLCFFPVRVSLVPLDWKALAESWWEKSSAYLVSSLEYYARHSWGLPKDFLEKTYFGLSHHFSWTKQNWAHSPSHTALTTWKIRNLPICFSLAIVAVLSNRRFSTCALSLSTFILAFPSLLYVPSGYFCQFKHFKVIAKVTPLYMLAATLLCF